MASDIQMTRDEFIRKQLEKFPWRPSVDVGLPTWVKVGHFVDIYRGAIIGETGFGLTKVNDRWMLIPHAGGVLIEDYVLVCSGSHIARATAENENTIIGENTMIDAMVHIAHNCKIGKRNEICAGAVFGGSVVTGDYVYVGLNATIKDHITLAEGVFIGLGAHVVRDCKKPWWVYADKVSESGMVYAQPIRPVRPEDY